MRPQTPEQIRQRLRNEGKTLKALAAEHGFLYRDVINVMTGRIKGVRGHGHHIAVTLGLKVPGTTDPF